jgi:hypothetical protein
VAQAALIPHVLTLQADLEGAPWPLEPAQFDGVVVTNVRRPNPDRFVQRICARKPVKMPG